MTFYELLWPESMMQIPKVEVIKSKKSVFKLCSELIGKYREGKGNSTVVDGKEFVAKEAVLLDKDIVYKEYHKEKWLEGGRGKHNLLFQIRKHQETE